MCSAENNIINQTLISIPSLQRSLRSVTEIDSGSSDINGKQCYRNDALICGLQIQLFAHLISLSAAMSRDSLEMNMNQLLDYVDTKFVKRVKW